MPNSWLKRLRSRFACQYDADFAVQLFRRVGIPRRARLLFLSVIIGLPVFLSANSAFADSVPGTPFAGRQYYFTTKMDLVNLRFWPNLGKTEQMPPVAQFQIPRAYIYFVAVKSHKNFKSVPGSVEVRWVNIMLVHPDGVPYSHAIRDYRKNYSASSDRAAKALRKLRIKAQISGSPVNVNKLSYLSPKPGDAPIRSASYFGFKRYTKNSSFETFYGPETALIRKIVCRRPLAKANHRQFCTYYVVLNKNLIATISFVDFRVYGGKIFAEERVRTFRASICRFATCNQFPPTPAKPNARD